MPQEVYFAGTRALLYGRSSSTTVLSSFAPSFDASIVPGSVRIAGVGSSGNFNQPTIRIPLNDELDEFWVHYELYVHDSSVTAQTFISARSASGSEEIGIASQVMSNNLGAMLPRYRNSAGNLINLAALTSFPSGSIVPLDFYFKKDGANGLFRGYQGGGLWFERTWTDGSTAKMTQIVLSTVHTATTTNSGSYFSQFCVSNFDMRGYKFPSRVITAAGAYNDGTGNAVDTGDLDFNTFKSLPDVDDQFSGEITPFSFPSGLQVDGVVVPALIRGASPVGDARVLVRTGGVDGYTPNYAPSLDGGFSIRSKFMPLNPATGLAWTQSDFNNSEYGIQAVGV
jgi:hypothetical protein